MAGGLAQAAAISSGYDGSLREGGSTYAVDWHTPNERRIDGDRITELIPAREWLSGRLEGDRGPDVNPLVVDDRGFYPPALPRFARRDHLHDRNRENALFDRANPGLATNVRVSRRRNPDPAAQAAFAARRAEVRRAEIAKEQHEAALGNQLLEARSELLRKAMAAKSRGNAMVQAGAWKKTGRPATAPTPDRLTMHTAALEKKLRLLADTTGMEFIQGLPPNALGGAAGKSAAEKAALAAPPPMRTTTTANRAGWPAGDHYFVYQKPKTFLPRRSDNLVVKSWPYIDEKLCA